MRVGGGARGSLRGVKRRGLGLCLGRGLGARDRVGPNEPDPPTRRRRGRRPPPTNFPIKPPHPHRMVVTSYVSTCAMTSPIASTPSCTVNVNSWWSVPRKEATARAAMRSGEPSSPMQKEWSLFWGGVGVEEGGWGWNTVWDCGSVNGQHGACTPNTAHKAAPPPPAAPLLLHRRHPLLRPQHPRGHSPSRPSPRPPFPHSPIPPTSSLPASHPPPLLLTCPTLSRRRARSCAPLWTPPATSPARQTGGRLLGGAGGAPFSKGVRFWGGGGGLGAFGEGEGFGGGVRWVGWGWVGGADRAGRLGQRLGAGPKSPGPPILLRRNPQALLPPPPLVAPAEPSSSR